MGGLLGGPISPHGGSPRKWLRRGRLVAEANLYGSLGVDLRVPAVAIGGYGRQRVLQRYAPRDVSKARPKAHGADVRQCRSEEHTSELQSRLHLVCRLLLEKKTRISH